MYEVDVRVDAVCDWSKERWWSAVERMGGREHGQCRHDPFARALTSPAL